MTWEEFWFIFIVCALCMLACRVLPLFLLKGRELPPTVVRALGLIPPAAFAALVASDLIAPDMFDGGIWFAIIPLIAAIIAAGVGVKTRSLIWSVIGGVASYALLLLI